MKVSLICRCFDKNSGQGVYKTAGYLYEYMKRYPGIEVNKIENTRKLPSYLFDVFLPLLMKKDMYECDIFHFLMPENLLPLLLIKKLRERSIVTIHDLIIYKIRERKKITEKYLKFFYNLSRYSKLIIAVSQQTKNDLIDVLRISENKIKVVKWGVKIPTKIKRKERDRKNIGYLGGFGKRKRIEWILYLAKKFPELNFKIAGYGPRFKNILELSKRLKLKNVEFLGFVNENEIHNFYLTIDVFVFPSLYEGFGLPLIEAMAHEVPFILSTPTGISPELPVYKFETFDDLVKKIKLIKNNMLKPLKNSRKWLKRNGFLWENTVKNLVLIYKEML